MVAIINWQQGDHTTDCRERRTCLQSQGLGYHMSVPGHLMAVLTKTV
ncbi:MAG: hypothetical protein MK102_17740 [Fuerstiella sp.]|nr:hypothetical protein [Fuerstiella sp.]